MRILVFLLIGALAGWIAGELIEGDGFGLVGNTVVGIIGAVVGGFVMNLAGREDTDKSFMGSLFTSTIGAVIFLLVANVLFG